MTMTDTTTLASPVSIAREGRVAVVTIDNPPVVSQARLDESPQLQEIIGGTELRLCK